MDIKFIELLLSDFTTYKIDKPNILECNFTIKNSVKNTTPVIESLLLVIDDYTKIINYDNEKDFDVNRTDISQVVIYYENDIIKIGYVNLDTNNVNQVNCLSDNRLYITIDEEI